jgi:hypothetical protein
VPAGAALVVAALVCVLAAAEMAGAHGSPRADAWRWRLEVATVPLLGAAVYVVLVRLAPLVGR